MEARKARIAAEFNALKPGDAPIVEPLATFTEAPTRTGRDPLRAGARASISFRHAVPFSDPNREGRGTVFGAALSHASATRVRKNLSCIAWTP